jgi:hypothetical protein
MIRKELSTTPQTGEDEISYICQRQMELSAHLPDLSTLDPSMFEINEEHCDDNEDEDDDADH